MTEVSGNVRPPVRDRQRKTKPGDKQVGLAIVSSEMAPTGEGLTTCSCGWSKFHKREKIRGDAAERHVNKAHNGRAIWL